MLIHFRVSTFFFECDLSTWNYQAQIASTRKINFSNSRQKVYYERKMVISDFFLLICQYRGNSITFRSWHFTTIYFWIRRMFPKIFHSKSITPILKKKQVQKLSFDSFSQKCSSWHVKCSYAVLRTPAQCFLFNVRKFCRLIRFSWTFSPKCLSGHVEIRLENTSRKPFRAKWKKLKVFESLQKKNSSWKCPSGHEKKINFENISWTYFFSLKAIVKF